jgi:uncharacterized protein involved in type VI secretion and phage assembly
MPDFNPGQLLPPLPDRTDLVSFSIKINGVPIPDAVRVKAIAVSHSANRVPFALVTLLDGDVAKRDFATSDMDIFSPGSDIEIQMGYHGDNETVFKGLIVRHALKIPKSGNSHIEVECKDKCVRLTAGRHNKYFFNQKDDAILQAVLRGKVTAQVESTSVLHKEMVQYFSSDWDFVVTRAEANGMLVLAKQGKVAVKKPDFSQKPKFPVVYGTGIYEFEAEMDARDQYPTAKTFTWNPSDQKVRETAPGGGGLGGVGSALGSAASVAASVGGAIGLSLPGVPPNKNYTKVMQWEHYPLQHAGNFTNEEAQQWAKAQMTKSELAKNRGRVKIAGVADIHPGDSVDLQGVGQRHSGSVYVTSVTHEMAEGAWFTHLHFGLQQQWHAQQYDDVTEVSASGLLPAIHGLQIGIVTRLENSPADADFRIQVRLPMVNPQGQGVWTRLAAQDAGNKRGAIWRPEIGDEVVVGFFNDDPRQGVVLGALHSSKNAAPLPAKDTNHEKGWVTRSNMRMIFNDDKKSLTIQTPGGKKILVDEDADHIQLSDQHGNKITMDKNGIVVESAKDMTLKAAQNLNLEATNITQKAKATFKAESQGQAQINATGDMVLKGTFVRIN